MKIEVAQVAKLFPFTPRPHIEANLPFVLAALAAESLDDKEMILMALGTIQAETASFLPISEGQSKYNTSPGAHPFNLYDERSELGNKGAPDGSNYRGRGFVQLTGRANYTHFAGRVGADLVGQPDLANDPAVAAKVLAAFLKARENSIRAALKAGDLRKARRLVNGGSNGLDRFQATFENGLALFA